MFCQLDSNQSLPFTSPVLPFGNFFPVPSPYVLKEGDHLICLLFRRSCLIFFACEPQGKPDVIQRCPVTFSICPGRGSGDIASHARTHSFIAVSLIYVLRGHYSAVHFGHAWVGGGSSWVLRWGAKREQKAWVNPATASDLQGVVVPNGEESADYWGSESVSCARVFTRSGHLMWAKMNSRVGQWFYLEGSC